MSYSVASSDGQGSGDALAQRLRLLSNGFEPIPVQGKRPAAGEGWQVGEITRQRITAQTEERPDALSTGLRTGKLVGVDIDVEDRAEAEEVRRVVEEHLGPTPFVRVGRKGFLLCYGNAEPIRKLTATRKSDGAKVEILGQGQQFVGYGPHPDTGQPYRWTGDAEPLTDGAWDLPPATPEQLRELMPRLKATLERQRAGAEVRISGAGLSNETSAEVLEFPGSRDLPPLPAGEILDRMFCLDPSMPRDDWIRVAAALRATPCADADFDKLRLFVAWSRGGANFTSDEDCETAWKTLPPKVGGVGSGTFIRMTNNAGYTGPTVARDAPPTAEIFGEALAPLLAGPAAVAAQPSSRFHLLFPDAMRSLPQPSYAVDRIVPDQGLVLIYGPTASLKTFLVLDILASTAAGIPAFAHLHTRQGPAILCAGESPFAVAQKRWPAFASARRIQHPEGVPFAIVPAVPHVSDPADIRALIAEIRAAEVRPRLIAVDTVARAVGGLDENDARAAGTMIAAAEMIRTELGCAVVLVHHSGKDESKGARGSSALAAGVDAIFRVNRAKDSLSVSLHCEKMKDADEPADIHLLGDTDAGSPVFHVVSADEHAAATRTNPPLSPGEVGKALIRAGAVSGVAISTSALAHTMAPSPDEKAISAMERRLQRAAEDKLAAYVVAETQGRRKVVKWTFPSLEQLNSEN